jgi:hypothetical protein
VLLIYGTGNRPVSLILHGHRGQTELQWDVDPGSHPSQDNRALVMQVLNERRGLLLDTERESYVDIE